MRTSRSTRSSTIRGPTRELQTMIMASPVKKKLRSELPRRRRAQISPVAIWTRNLVSNDDHKNSGDLASFSVDSSSCSYFCGEVSCESSRVSDGSESKSKAGAILRKREFEEIGSYGGFVVENKLYCIGAVASEVSESSCVESNCDGDGVLGDRRLKVKSSRGKGGEIAKEIEISGAGNLNVDTKENEVVSCISASESCLQAKLAENKKEEIIRAEELEKSFTVSNSESTIDQRPEPEMSFGIDSELACTENFCDDSYSDCSSTQETACSELQSDIFLENSELDFSDYSPSIFVDSGSEFSERSEGDSTPSLTFSLLLRYREHFLRSTSAKDTELVSSLNEEYMDESRYSRFEDVADEDSYQLLRIRERSSVVLHDYLDEYSSTTEYGKLILDERFLMINWIIERCKETDIQPETMFLGVNLFDRFLSKGFFKNKRILQIVGLACLALATRIEENQPYNSVRQKNILVGRNLYSRCEVVAMEWLVQEVLNFRCLLPTIYNFLWFYLKAARADEEVEKRAKYLAVLLLTDQVQMYYLPSTVAAAVVILASLEGNHDSPIQRVMETHIRTKCDDLHECIESLEWLLKYV